MHPTYVDYQRISSECRQLMRLAQYTPKVMSAYSLVRGSGAPLSAAPLTALSGGLVASLSKWSVIHGRKELPVIPDGMELQLNGCGKVS